MRAGQARRGLRATVFGAAVTTAAVGAAVPATAAETVACGAEVTADLVLTADLDCAGPALVVRGSGITVDLDGHRIRHIGPTGEGVPPVVGIHVDGEATGGGPGSPTGVTVRDGRIEGYALAVAADLAFDTTVTGLDTEGVVRGLRGNGLAVRDSWVGGVGLAEQVTGATRPSTIAGNRIAGGLHLAEVFDVDIAGNDIRPAGADGVATFESADVRVAGNRITGADAAVHVGGGSGRIQVTGNRLGASRVGVEVVSFASAITIAGNDVVRTRSSGVLLDVAPDGSAGTVRVEDNRVRAAGWGQPVEGEPRDGITVSGPASPFRERVTVAGNAVVRAAGRAVDAPGVTDGGGNRARRAGLSPACVGVICG